MPIHLFILPAFNPLNPDAVVVLSLEDAVPGYVADPDSPRNWWPPAGWGVVTRSPPVRAATRPESNTSTVVPLVLHPRTPP